MFTDIYWKQRLGHICSFLSFLCYYSSVSRADFKFGDAWKRAFGHNYLLGFCLFLFLRVLFFVWFYSRVQASAMLTGFSSVMRWWRPYIYGHLLKTAFGHYYFLVFVCLFFMLVCASLSLVCDCALLNRRTVPTLSSLYHAFSVFSCEVCLLLWISVLTLWLLKHDHCIKK